MEREEVELGILLKGTIKRDSDHLLILAGPPTGQGL